MSDAAGAFDAFEQALALDASEDELRARYVTLAGKLERSRRGEDAVRVLATVKDPR